MERYAGILACLLPLVCHLGFSWIGFNPTDEGWLQAVARRILEGEVPHRDFVWVRPALSPLLQVPLVWLGSDYLFWLARLWGWLELAVISWLWAGILLPVGTSRLIRLAAYAAACLLNAHVFPVMAWHTLDGLLFCTVAVALARRGTPGAWCFAFCCAGLAPLCRQNFALFVPVLALGLPSLRALVYLLWAGFPPALYLLFLAWNDAVPAFFTQLYASGGALYETAFREFAVRPGFWVAVTLGLIAAGWLHRFPRHRRWLPGLLVIALSLRAAWSLTRGSAFTSASFEFFGAACAFVAALYYRRPGTEALRSPLVQVVALAWICSISHGYNTPAITAGLLFLVIVRSLADLGGSTASPSPPLSFALALLAIAPAFIHARQTYPYLDRPVSDLNYAASDHVRGAAGLRTNALTYHLLADLRSVTDRLEASRTPYAILTDYSAVWALSPRRNPLRCEWPQPTELSSKPALLVQIRDQICALPAGTVIIVQRHIVSMANHGLVPITAEMPFYAIQNWLSAHGQKVESTPAFNLYLAPRLAPPRPPENPPRHSPP